MVAIPGWIVVREERHIDDKFWVCLTREDAVRVAAAVAQEWRDQCGVVPGAPGLDETCYGDQVFHCDVEDCFRVYAQPQSILEAGEAHEPERW